MDILPSAPAAAQEQYRIQAGVGDKLVEIDIEVQAGIIVAAPPIWNRWVGQELHRLEWWLAAAYGTSQTRRVGV